MKKIQKKTSLKPLSNKKLAAATGGEMGAVSQAVQQSSGISGPTASRAASDYANARY